MAGTNVHSDLRLLKRIADGDEGAFEIFFKSVSPVLKAHLQRIIKDPYGLMDVLQETFIKIWLNRDKFPSITHINAYLKRIAANEAFTYLNKQQLVEKQVVTDAVGDLPMHGEIEETLSYKETYHIVQSAINTLPHQRKKIYQMSRLDGLKAPEIAKRLNLSNSYVRNAISQAQHAIRERLLESGKIIFCTIPLFFSSL